MLQEKLKAVFRRNLLTYTWEDAAQLSDKAGGFMIEVDGKYGVFRVVDTRPKFYEVEIFHGPSLTIERIPK